MKTLEELNLSPLVAVVDIETLGKATNAKVASVGCVVVDLLEGEQVGQFYRRIDHKGQYGRSSDASTLTWWAQQQQESPEAWAEVFAPDLGRERLPDALIALAAFLKEHFGDHKVQLMGNGPEFDNVILAHAYGQEGIAQPWHYGGNQSLRTAVLFGRLFLGLDPKYDLAFTGPRHHALFDASHEAEYLVALTRPFARLRLSPLVDVPLLSDAELLQLAQPAGELQCVEASADE